MFFWVLDRYEAHVLRCLVRMLLFLLSTIGAWCVGVIVGF